MGNDHRGVIELGDGVILWAATTTQMKPEQTAGWDFHIASMG
jgi:hypothetical protein